MTTAGWTARRADTTMTDDIDTTDLLSHDDGVALAEPTDALADQEQGDEPNAVQDATPPEAPDAVERRKERAFRDIMEILHHNGLQLRAVLMPLEPVGRRTDQAMVTARWTLDPVPTS